MNINRKNFQSSSNTQEYQLNDEARVRAIRGLKRIERTSETDLFTKYLLSYIDLLERKLDAYDKLMNIFQDNYNDYDSFKRSIYARQKHTENLVNDFPLNPYTGYGNPYPKSKPSTSKIVETNKDYNQTYKKYYIVYKGDQIGLYTSLSDCMDIGVGDHQSPIYTAVRGRARAIDQWQEFEDTGKIPPGVIEKAKNAQKRSMKTLL